MKGEKVFTCIRGIDFMTLEAIGMRLAIARKLLRFFDLGTRWSKKCAGRDRN
jgi:hypothetical protein